MNSAPAPPRPAPVAPAVVTVVFSAACHYCDDAMSALAGLGASYPLLVDRVDIRSEPGQVLTREHRPPLSPLVLLDGTFFSFGRLPRRKLAKALDRRLAELGARS